MAKVARTELIRLLAGWTNLAVFDDTEASIEDTICDGLIVLVGLVGEDFDDGALDEVLGIRDSKLNSDDSITHVEYLLLLCVDYSVLFHAKPKQRYQWNHLVMDPCDPLQSKNKHA